MNRKSVRIFLVIAIAILGFVQNANAQWAVGLNAGYTYNTMETESGYYYNRDYQPGSGFAIGVPVQYSFYDWLAVRVEPTFINKNYKWERVIGVSVMDVSAYTNSYIDLPIMAKFSLKKGKFSGFVNLGGYVGMWASSYVSCYYTQFLSPYSQYNGFVDFNSESDNRFDAGLLIGLGLEYEISDRISCFAEGRLMWGLTDLQKDYMIGLYPKYNTTLLAQVGVMFHF